MTESFFTQSFNHKNSCGLSSSLSHFRLKYSYLHFYKRWIIFLKVCLSCNDRVNVVFQWHSPVGPAIDVIVKKSNLLLIEVQDTVRYNSNISKYFILLHKNFFSTLVCKIWKLFIWRQLWIVVQKCHNFENWLVKCLFTKI